MLPGLLSASRLGASPCSLGRTVCHISVFENSNECLGVFVDELNLFVWNEPDRDEVWALHFNVLNIGEMDDAIADPNKLRFHFNNSTWLRAPGSTR